MKESTIQRIEVVNSAKDVERRVLLSTYNGVTIFGYRPGQALMNALDHVAPELYDILSGSLADCFYQDSKISAALAELGYDEARFRKAMDGQIRG